jgi:hypothetical protein
MTLRLESLKILPKSCKGNDDQEKLKSLRDHISAIQAVGIAIENQQVG